MKIRKKPDDLVWGNFQHDEKLTDEQLEKFKAYESFLSQKNDEFNLTAITDLSGIVRQHFIDSLSIRKFADLSKLSTIVDIGSGAGFPGIPLKIMFPHLQVILLEVTNKKKIFLNDVIKILELDNITVCEYDWRTFLRITDYPVDLFVTRAAFDDEELCRAFKPGCKYKQVPIAYWASVLWEVSLKAVPFVKSVFDYKLGNKQRKMVFLGLKNDKS
ncbi:MAG: 16S rRNA (guanine(527)-N(7))-methyltransferase RsmG [bacterium]